MKLRNRIEKYKDNLTETQLEIGNKLCSMDIDKIINTHISRLSFLLNASKTTLYSMIRNLDFKSIYEFRAFLSEKRIDNSKVAAELDLTSAKLSSVNPSSILDELINSEEVVIISKGFGSSISSILSRKLRKLGFSISEIIGDSGFDLLVKSRKYFIIYITISGRFMNTISNDVKNVLSYPNLAITHSKPPKQTVENFKYILYGSVISDYSREEFENPQNTLIIMLQIINWFVNEIQIRKPVQKLLDKA